MTAFPPSLRKGNTEKPFAAKLVKSFGRLGEVAESSDDFRYECPR
jgi:hypothetical protein